MQSIAGNIWDFHAQGSWIVIPTNLTVTANHHAVMGAGLARQASERFPLVPEKLGQWVRTTKDAVLFLREERLIAFPTKRDWKYPADPLLIQECARQLRDQVALIGNLQIRPSLLSPHIYLPRLGCGLGQLRWDLVEPLLDKFLGYGKYIVVH